MLLNTTDHRGRRRLTFACAVTLVALPALWFLDHRAERDDGAGDTTTTSAAPSAPGTVSGGTTADSIDPLSLDESIYLSGDGTEQPEVVVEAAVPPAPDGKLISARATFSSNFSQTGLCVGGPGEAGTSITVTNVNNDRSIECELVSGNGIINPDAGTVVLDRATYLQIADASDAPVPVEIRR